MQAEKIFYNGNVLTQDDTAPHAQAFALAAGRFMAVGDDAAMLALAGPETELIDMEGQTIVPGLGDSHMHLLHLGFAMERVDLCAAKSAAHMALLGQEFLQEHGELAWMEGWGWNHEKFEQNNDLPSRADLDLISTALPILFSRTCGHIAVANSRALTLAGIGANPEQPAGGHIDVDAAGVPTGILRENAIGLVRNLAPQPAAADYKRALLLGATHAAQQGLTFVHSDDLSGHAVEVLSAYRELVEEDVLPLRVSLQIRLYQPQEVAEFVQIQKDFKFPPHTVEYGPIKVMTDGSLGGRTAALNSPYADDSSTCGVEVLNQETITGILLAAHEEGMQMSGHAIGDRGMDMLLNAFEAAVQRSPRADARPRVIHAQLTTPEILGRMQELGVVCDIQPGFLGTDLHIVERRIGRRRARSSYAWKTMRQRGIMTAGGSDCPVETCDPLVGIQQAVTRQDMDGFPAGGWLPQERLSIDEALQLFTLGPAYSSFNEQVLGSISPGKLADWVVLDRDILTVAADKIADIEVRATYVGGRRRS